MGEKSRNWWAQKKIKIVAKRKNSFITTMIKILTSSLTLMPTGEAGLHSGPINIYSHLSFSLHIIIACIIIVNFMITIFSAWMEELSNISLAYFLLCRIPRAMLRFICEQGTFCWFWVAHEKCLWSRQVRKIRNCPLLFVCLVSPTLSFSDEIIS